MIFAKDALARLRARVPLVHFITNYVTVNDCANMTLACGGSPIMSDEEMEVEAMVSLCSALVLNIGTVNQRTLASMLRAGRRANRLGLPVLLDPAGAGTTDFRNLAVNQLLKEVDFSAIKGNISEIKFLSYGITSTQGVDAAASDLVGEENLEEAMRFTQRLSIMTGSVIAVTGPIDIVADGVSGYALQGGHPLMTSVSGTGCMTAAVTGCFLGADPGVPLNAVVNAVAAMGLCGEMAHERLRLANGGTSTYRGLIIDAMSRLTDADLRERARLRQMF